MNFVKVEVDDGIATVALNRGKVNALNDEVVDVILPYDCTPEVKPL